MSSMRSASSSTRNSSPAELRVGRPEVVEQAAGRGDDDVHAAAGRRAPAAPCRRRRRPAAPVMGVCTARSFRSSRIWAASSRVGVSTSARVVPRGLSISLCRIGRRKAAVLPLPVTAQASTSRPASAGGMASVWMGVGRVKPSSLRARVRLGCSPRCEKGTQQCTGTGNREPGSGRDEYEVAGRSRVDRSRHGASAPGGGTASRARVANRAAPLEYSRSGAL